MAQLAPAAAKGGLVLPPTAPPLILERPARQVALPVELVQRIVDLAFDAADGPNDVGIFAAARDFRQTLLKLSLVGRRSHWSAVARSTLVQRVHLLSVRQVDAWRARADPSVALRELLVGPGAISDRFAAEPCFGELGALVWLRNGEEREQWFLGLVGALPRPPRRLVTSIVARELESWRDAWFEPVRSLKLNVRTSAARYAYQGLPSLSDLARSARRLKHLAIVGSIHRPMVHDGQLPDLDGPVVESSVISMYLAHIAPDIIRTHVFAAQIVWTGLRDLVIDLVAIEVHVDPSHGYSASAAILLHDLLVYLPKLRRLEVVVRCMAINDTPFKPADGIVRLDDGSTPRTRFGCPECQSPWDGEEMSCSACDLAAAELVSVVGPESSDGSPDGSSIGEEAETCPFCSALLSWGDVQCSSCGAEMAEPGSDGAESDHEDAAVDADEADRWSDDGLDDGRDHGRDFDGVPVLAGTEADAGPDGVHTVPIDSALEPIADPPVRTSPTCAPQGLIRDLSVRLYRLVAVDCHATSVRPIDLIVSFGDRDHPCNEASMRQAASTTSLAALEHNIALSMHIVRLCAVGDAVLVCRLTLLPRLL